MSRVKAVIILIFLLIYQIIPDLHAKVRASVSTDYDSWQNLSFTLLKEKANDFINREMPDSALLCYTIMANRLDKVTSSPDRLEAASATMNVGYMYSAYFYNFHHAFDNFSKALKIAQEENDTSLMAACYVNLGSLYSTYHHMVDDKTMLNDAINTYSKAYQISKKADKQSSLLISVSNLAVVSLETDTSSIIKTILNDFLSIDSCDKSERWLQVKAFITGLLAVGNNDKTKASENLKESLGYKTNHDIPNKYEANILLALSINSLKNGDLAEAEKSCLEVLTYARAHGFMDIVSLAYRLLGNIYSTQGNLSKTNEYRLKYYNFKDSLAEASKIKEVKDLRFLEELDAKNEQVRQLASQKQSQHHILIITLLALGVAAMVIIIILIHTKRLRKRNSQLYDRLQESLARWAEESKAFIMITEASPVPLGDNKTDMEQESKYKNSTLSDAEKTDILNRVKGFMATSEQIFSPEFSLDQLAIISEINRSYISQFVNETGGSNFKTLLNSYRIREACRRFEDTATYGGQTIEAIGQSVGFLSRRNFGIAFKKETGLTPSAFVKTHHEKQNER